jgi:hypothetical protein
VGAERSIPPALIEVLFRHWLGLSGIEPGALIEVVGEGFLGDLLSFPTRVPDTELGLGRSSGGMDEGGRSGLAYVGQDLGDGFRLGEDREEYLSRTEMVTVGPSGAGEETVEGTPRVPLEPGFSLLPLALRGIPSVDRRSGTCDRLWPNRHGPILANRQSGGFQW